MLPTEASIAQGIASSVTSMTTYIILSLLSAFLIYYFHILDFFEIPNSYKMLLSLVIPITLWEFILSFVFGSVGIPLNWGSYAYNFPLLGDFIVTSGVQLSKFLDFVFNFGLAREFGIPYLTNFVNNTQIPTTAIPQDLNGFGVIKMAFSSWFNMFVWIYVSGDSIIDLIFFFVLFSAILAVVAENLENSKLKLYAFGLAWIPVILYSYYISNPFTEFPNALVMLERVFYFWDNADSWALIMFFGTLILSFLIVMEIVAMVVHLGLKGGSMTLQPEWQSKEWTSSQHGIAFGYTLAFAIMYGLHEYSWYVVFPFLIIYTMLKKIGGAAINTAHAHAEKNEMRDLISGISNNGSQPTQIQSTDKSSNNIEIIIYMGILIIIIALLYNNGII